MKLVIGQDARGQRKQGLVELYTSMLEWKVGFKISSAPHSMVVQGTEAEADRFLRVPGLFALHSNFQATQGNTVSFKTR